MRKLAEWMTVAEVARVFVVTPETIRQWANTGKLPVTRTENGWRIFQRADVERLRRQRQSQEEARG